MRHSKLFDISGIGKKKATELLVKFGSAEKVAALSPEELQKVPGIGQKLAEKILSALQEEESTK